MNYICSQYVELDLGLESNHVAMLTESKLRNRLGIEKYSCYVGQCWTEMTDNAV